jgi:hypothetical protein
MIRMRTIAVAVAMLYMLLAAVVGACPDYLNGGSGAHHAGHHGKPMHSPLCAWACQLSFPGLVHSAHPGEPLLGLFVGLSAALLFAYGFPAVALREARGPPR